ncbi:uncharacterized protein LOC111611007 [Xiphophorus maculatus]|uniref:uncharacterized protein LOC111611007 n=1 Tax=Xiphophorus maculatus TaxID=8083 RepID=UPI000C6E5A21|nr:uncharacterized protein LOC111611007 [Xiphophorus maculatus]
MDKRLIFCVLLVMLSGRFVGAENTTTAPPSNMLTTPTTKMTATAENSVTSLTNVSTTPASNMTATAVPVTNVSMAASTQFVLVSPNTTVLTLEANITNAECGSKQLCIAEPPKCDPFVTGSCFFFAAKQESGRNFNFDLSGESNGYIAATLTGGVGQGDPTYICANSKGKVKFFSSVLNNGVLNISELNVNSVKGKIKGKVIQCRFLATVPEPKTRATTLGVAVSTGEYNDTNDSLGTPKSVINVSAVDLANPNNNVTNEIANTTTPASNMTATAVPVTNVSMAASTQFVLVSPNTTVLTLEANITNAECGSKQLCIAEPPKCDPFVTGSCFFFAAKQESGRNFNFDLSGESNGYIAATLTGGVGQGDPTYICANSKGKVKFFSSVLNNGVLNISELNVNSVKGKIKGKVIQCRFLATVPEPKTRATTLGVMVSTGEYNDTNDVLSTPISVIKVSAVDLANPDNNVTNEIANTTTPAPTGNNATTVAPTGTLIPQLSTAITRQECGTTKLCAAEPSKCDPTAGTSCYFLSVKQQSGQIYNFELSGQSDGYVAAGLSTSAIANGTHTAYICANENGNVRFFTGTIDNFVINLKLSQNSSNERGTVNGNKIQCTFSADLPDSSVRTANYALSISNGTYDAKTLQLGKTTFRLLTSSTNLSDPTANLTNLINNAPINYASSFIPALLVTVYMLAFTAM